MDRCDFERLNRIEQEYFELPVDLRALREEALRESASLSLSSTPNSKRGTRPFQKLVLAQQEKLKRDKYLRDRLLKERRQEQHRLERKEDNLNRAMDLRNNSQSANKAHRSKRSMSALFNLMRPISTAFLSDNANTSMLPKRSAAELDFTPTQKPTLVLSLVDASVGVFINNERSFTFLIDTEDGGHYCLQARSKGDMNQWISTMSTTVRSHAQRRLTYMGDASQLQFSDHIQPRVAAPPQDPRAGNVTPKIS